MEAIESLKPETTGTGINEKSPVNEGEFLTAEQVVTRLGIGRGRLRRWQQDGIVPHIRVAGGRKLLFFWPDVRTALVRLQRGGEA